MSARRAVAKGVASPRRGRPALGARRLVPLVSAALVLLSLAAGMLAPLARADGDPASDWLLAQSTFLSPYDGHVSSVEATKLVEMLTQLKAKGFGLKVAVIVTAYDLGSVPILYRKPEIYAKFLGEEDYYYWKDELLVVMPNGYGIYSSSGLPAGDVAAIHGLKFTDTTSGTALVVDAQTAVRALAARRGISLSASGSTSAGSSSGQERIEIGVGVVVLLLIGVGARFGWRRYGAR